METITKHDYTINLISPRKAIVSGGILSRPVTIGKLLGKGDANPKTAKNIVPTVGLSLLPFNFVGFGNVCPHAINCPDICLGVATGQSHMTNVNHGRAARTVLYYLAREWFLESLNRELSNFRKRNRGTIGARLNMFSDIPWEHHDIVDIHPDITFYDYTKNPRRWGQVRKNYWVTFSYDGTTKNSNHAETILANGGNVSVVYYDEDGMCGRAAHRQTLPSSDMGHEVIDGGLTDWRPDDPRGVIVGLRLLARTYASRNEAINSGFARLAGQEVAV